MWVVMKWSACGLRAAHAVTIRRRAGPDCSYSSIGCAAAAAGRPWCAVSTCR
jgi:hypothetical protein